MKEQVIVRTEPIGYDKFGRSQEKEFVFGSVSRAIDVALDFAKKGFISEVIKEGEIIFTSL